MKTASATIISDDGKRGREGKGCPCLCLPSVCMLIVRDAELYGCQVPCGIFCFYSQGLHALRHGIIVMMLPSARASV